MGGSGSIEVAQVSFGIDSEAPDASSTIWPHGAYNLR
jgi:hypothetical protein